MRVIRIVKKGKSDVTVHFDEDKFLILAVEVFLKSGLKKGDEISDDRFSIFIEQNKLFHIKQRAYRLLGRRQHSTSELKRKLWQKDYEQKLIDEVIDELSKKGFLNDEQFIRDFAAEKSKTKNWSSKRIKAELMKRGIDLKQIELNMVELPKKTEYENAIYLADKKYSSLFRRNLDPTELKNKLSTYLYSKGFDYELIKDVCNKIMKGNTEEE